MAITNSNETKKIMASSFKKLVMKKTFSKITIGEIAKESAMTRENFYYHFKDKYDICHWIFKQQVLSRLPGDDESFESWIFQLNHLIMEDGVYYRKMIKGLGFDGTRDYLYPYFERRIAALVHTSIDDSVWNMRKEKESFVVSFFTDSFLCFLINYILEHEELEEEDLQIKYHFLLEHFLTFTQNEN